MLMLKLMLKHRPPRRYDVRKLRLIVVGGGVWILCSAVLPVVADWSPAVAGAIVANMCGAGLVAWWRYGRGTG